VRPVTEQLALFAEPARDAVHVRLTRDEAGLAHDVPAGAERLLGALVKRGLPEGDLRAAAKLCLALEDVAVEEGES
jgi:hypothetical protein